MVYGLAAMWPGGEASAARPVLLLTALLVLASRPRPALAVAESCSETFYKKPQCVDNPNRYLYSCECGPGFFWNTRMCVALGIDSRLEFAMEEPIRYTTLMYKQFPRLDHFTLALWMKVQKSVHPGTVISYMHGGKNILRVTSGPSLNLKVHDGNETINFRFNGSQWVHFTWTWTSMDGSWHAYIDGGVRGHFSGVNARSVGHPIPAGGELVLGQDSRGADHQFDHKKAFLGEIGFVNMWHHVMSRDYVAAQLVGDCIFMHCGDAVQWADFRSGTRGAMRIRWPSLIYGVGRCYSSEEASLTCDKYCITEIGALCTTEVVENVKWERTKAGETRSVPCPGLLPVVEDGVVLNVTVTAFANRTCLKTAGDEGEWDEPNVDDCVSEKELDLKRMIGAALRWKQLNETVVMGLAEDLRNVTAQQHYRTALDIAAVVDSVDMLVQAQGKTLNDISVRKGSQKYTQRPERYPPFEEASEFLKVIGTVVDSLVAERNEGAWLGSQPPGAEGHELMLVLEAFLDLLAHCLNRTLLKGDVNFDTADLSAFKRQTAIRTKIYKMEDLKDIDFPTSLDFRHVRASDMRDQLTLPADAILDFNLTTLPESLAISTARVVAPNILPNHNITRKTRDMEDNVNSALISLFLHSDDRRFLNLPRPFIIKFTYLDNFNVSNPECVRLVHGNSSQQWNWSRDGCVLLRNTSRAAECQCFRPGVFAITTDMYNVDWDRGEIPNILMEIPSYIGCSVSALLCLISCLMLIYLRTASKTAAIHKNFAVAIVLSQLNFMLGIDKIQVMTLCHVSAISFHYFFLATFSWLMNEAFNLYIVITYAAHAHGEHAESGSQWRYYILGWILPGVLVGAFVGTHTDDYYAPDMCWIAWEYIWLFLGPAIGIISVTVLVMIFTAKEHHESSYSKNEKTNKMILIHSRALWTQVILLTVCWTFAFITLKMRGIILKVIYCLFTSLQGAFFVVFYFLLNDEVRAVLKAKRKKKNMAKQGYEYSDSDDSSASGNEMMERETTIAGPSEAGSTITGNSTPRTQPGNRKKRKQKSQIEASSDEGSDCEIMITSV